jgi:hypothetical protein
MKKYLAIGAGVLLLFVGASSADAAGGCGIGFHRGPYGGCRANGGPVVVAPVGPVGRVIFAPLGRACPVGYHLGPQGRRCWPN